MNRSPRFRLLLISSTIPALLMLGACGGGSGGGAVSSTPPPPPIAPPPPPSPPPPPPPPPTGTNFDTAEFRRSNAVVQSGAIAAYNAGATGSGVVAAVIDSGIDANSAEFAGRILSASADLAGSRGIQDEGGHGTAVSSVLLGAKDDIGAHGVAFNAQLLVARTDTIGSCAGVGPEDSCSHNDNAIARGVDLAVANRARVVNISLGGSPANATLRAAIGRATANGVVIVISAGNDGVENPSAAVNPDLFAQIANDPLARNLVIIAGALDSSNAALASFSNKAGNGAIHYLGALGSRVRGIDENGGAFLFSGTSFSAPVISGAVALLAGAFPNLTGAQIVDLLFRTANDLGAAGIDGEFGQGALNLARAFAPQGATALAGTAIPVSLTPSGTTSAPIGDAGKTGFSTIILDSFGRAYETEIGGARSAAPLTPRLAQGLNIGTRSFGFQTGAITASLSIAQASRDNAAERLMLTGQQTDRARALAGQIIAQLGEKTSIAFGISQSGLALAKDYRESASSAFLIGRSATRDWGFDARAKSGLALGHRLGGIDWSIAGETGAVSNIDRVPRSRGLDQRSGYAAFSLGAARRFGPFSLSGHATWLRENETLLGSRLADVFGANGADSFFADANIVLTPARDWRMSAAWRQGFTRLGAAGVRQSIDRLQTSAWSFDIARDNLFAGSDSLALRIAQPLRISKGGLNLTLPTGYDYASGTALFGVQRLNLAPDGRELDIEAVYAVPLLGGLLSANLFWRQDPGNIAASPSDKGGAIRFSLGL
jgi:subtilisin family serine protease